MRPRGAAAIWPRGARGPQGARARADPGGRGRADICDRPLPEPQPDLGARAGRARSDLDDGSTVRYPNRSQILAPAPVEPGPMSMMASCSRAISSAMERPSPLP